MHLFFLFLESASEAQEIEFDLLREKREKISSVNIDNETYNSHPNIGNPE